MRNNHAFSGQTSGQTTMIFLILIIIIFIGMSTFLLGLAKNISQSEYLNIYTHSLLSSIMKANTGYLDSQCRTVADAVACSFLSPTYVCGGVVDCYTLANQKINESMTRFLETKEGFSHLITVEPEGFTVIGSGEVRRIEFGDLSLLASPGDKISANERIDGVFDGKSYILNVRLLVTKKLLDTA